MVYKMKKHMSGVAYFVGALSMSLPLTGCLKDGGAVVLISKVALREISFFADKDANSDRVTEVHLVVPKTPALYEEVLKMDSQAYFGAVKQLETDYPNDIEILKWEVAPGTTVKKQRIVLKDFRGQGALIFMRYGDDKPGAHRLVLPKQKSVRVLLKRKTGILSY